LQSVPDAVPFPTDLVGIGVDEAELSVPPARWPSTFTMSLALAGWAQNPKPQLGHRLAFQQF
jgi:hypothetical protein